VNTAIRTTCNGTWVSVCGDTVLQGRHLTVLLFSVSNTMYVYISIIYMYIYSKLNDTIKSQIKHYRISVYNNNNNTNKTHDSEIGFCTILVNSYFYVF